jgi:hypothetical protein
MPSLPNSKGSMRKATIKIMHGRNVLLSGVISGDATDEQLFDLEQAINSHTAFRCHIEACEAEFPKVGSTVTVKGADAMPTYEGIVQQSTPACFWIRVKKVDGKDVHPNAYPLAIPCSIDCIVMPMEA